MKLFRNTVVYITSTCYKILGGGIMQEKRKRILAMLENGNISMDEALTLLEQLEHEKTNEKATISPSSKNEQKQQTTSEEDTSFYDEEKVTDDFFNDLRTEFTEAGNRFMNFMQSTVEKVKDFEFDSPLSHFGKSVTFHKTLTASAKDLEDIEVIIENGKIAIHETDDEEIRAEFFVKAYNNDSVEEAEDIFQNEVVFARESDNLRLKSNLKMMSMEVELFIPKKELEKVSVKLFNGSFFIKGFNVEKLKVKTANGKIGVEDSTFEKTSLSTSNGSITLKGSTGREAEVETLNGKIYIDGKIITTVAKSMNGNVAITTSHPQADYVEAKTISGNVELYLPANRSLQGELSTNVGKLYVQLEDVQRVIEQEQLLQKSTHFKKEVENSLPLRIRGDVKSGTVIVYYNPKKEA